MDTVLTSWMRQRTGVDGSVLMQEHMPRLRHQVTGGPVREAPLEGARRLIEQRPGVLLADGGVEGLQDLLQVDAVRRIQRELRPAGRAGVLLAHHRAYPAGLPSILGTNNTTTATTIDRTKFTS